MKVFLLLAVVVVARATVIPVAPVGVEEGASAQFRSEDNLGNYNFGYNEDHTSGGSFRREAGDAHGNVAGSYGLRDADGRVRIVNYVANDDGFHADIKTNEPGVEPKDTADATFNKAAETVVVQAAVPAPVVVQAEQVASSHVFPPAPYVAPVKSSETAVYSFPEPAAVPVAKTHQTTITETKPIPYAFPAPAAVPVAKSIAAAPVVAYAAAPVAYATAPVAKSTTTTLTQTHPVSYAFPAPAAVPVAKSSTITQSGPALVGAYATPIAAKTIATTKVAVAEPAPISYAFPAPAAVPVAKSATTTITQSGPAAYAFPAPAAVPVAKSSTTTITQSGPAVAIAEPVSYAFPAPAAVPVAKSHTTTITQSGPAAYAFPAPAAVPVAKSSTTTITQSGPAVAIAEPVSYAFPAPAAVPVAKSIAVAETAPVAYSAFPASTGYVAKSGYAPSSAFTYAPRYALNSYLNGLQYGGPFYRSIYSPVVASFAGPVPYFSNIEYHGYPVLKK